MPKLPLLTALQLALALLLHAAENWPRAAFYCEEGLKDMRMKGSENCRRALLGQPVRNVVNAIV